MQVISDLYDLDLTRKETQKVFSSKTRDNDDQTVIIDTETGIIFLEKPTSHKEAYHSGDYRSKSIWDERQDSGHVKDATRRVQQFKGLLTGRRVLEFGCGNGLFLHHARQHTEHCAGLELQRNFVEALNQEGIPCISSLAEVADESFDTVFLFHVFEHLEDPIGALREIKKKLRPAGRVVIEVPHARDCLLTEYKSAAFKDHTLWSQHIVLHTKESLRRFCEAADLAVESAGGIQRYGLENHLAWLATPDAADKSRTLAHVVDVRLNQEYERALSERDVTDTIYCVAS